MWQINSSGDRVVQGRQTRQNSGGVADLTKGGLLIFFNFYAIKISIF